MTSEFEPHFVHSTTLGRGEQWILLHGGGQVGYIIHNRGVGQYQYFARASTLNAVMSDPDLEKLKAAAIKSVK